MSPAPNVHATAIVIGTTGLLFVGPSGSGKTSTALHCLQRARENGLFSALVSDDQVLIRAAGGRLIAHAPPSISGLAEIRGAAIAELPAIEAAVMHRAVRPMRPPFSERLAPEAETIEVFAPHRLPVTRLPLAEGGDSFSTLLALLPQIARG